MADLTDVRFWGERKRELERRIGAEIDAGRAPKVATVQALLGVRALIEELSQQVDLAAQA